MRTLADLAAMLPQVGTAAGLGVRPGHREPVALPDALEPPGSLIRLGDAVRVEEPA